MSSPSEIFSQTRSIIEAIENEANDARLKELLLEATTICDHEFEEVHNKIVVGGADEVLIRLLDKAVANPEHRWAIDPLCKLLLLIYRCADDRFQDSVSLFGEDIFPALLATMFLNHDDFSGQKPGMNLMKRLNQTKIDLRDVPWSRYVLDLFQGVIERIDTVTDIQPIAFIMEWLVDGLLLTRENNKRFLMNHTTIFGTIATKFATTFQSGCEVNLLVGRFMKIMAFATANRLLMVESPSFLRLEFLLLHDESVESKNVAFETLALMSLDRAGRTKIIGFLDQKFIDLAVNAMEIKSTTQSAMNFLEVIIPHVPRTNIISRNPLLVRRLADHALSERHDALVAAQSIAKLAKSSSAMCKGEGHLLDSILRLCDSRDRKIRFEGAKALLRQPQKHPAFSFYMVRLPEVIETLQKLAKDDSVEVRAVAMDVVAKLVAKPMNARVLARHSSIAHLFVSCRTPEINQGKNLIGLVECLDGNEIANANKLLSQLPSGQYLIDELGQKVRSGVLSQNKKQIARRRRKYEAQGKENDVQKQ